jgi:hypothetical protein
MKLNASLHTPNNFVELFFFESYSEFEEQIEEHRTDPNFPIEDLIIEFTDGSNEEAQLFKEANVTTANLELFFDIIDSSDDRELATIYHLMDNYGYEFEDAVDKMDEADVREGSLNEVARELFDELYLHEIPEHVRYYIDYDSFAHDCEVGGDLTEFRFGNTDYTCTNANQV